MTSPEVDFLTGAAQLLNDAGIAVYKTGTAYASTDIGVAFGGFTPNPSTQVALATYIVTVEPPPSNDVILGLQVMIRGTKDPLSVRNLSGQIRGEFDGLGRQWFGQLFLALMWLQSGRLDGRDEQQRWLSSENYYARVNWPTQYRTE